MPVSVPAGVLSTAERLSAYLYNDINFSVCMYLP